MIFLFVEGTVMGTNTSNKDKHYDNKIYSRNQYVEWAQTAYKIFDLTERRSKKLYKQKDLYEIAFSCAFSVLFRQSLELYVLHIIKENRMDVVDSELEKLIINVFHGNEHIKTIMREGKNPANNVLHVKYLEHQYDPPIEGIIRTYTRDVEPLFCELLSTKKQTRSSKNLRKLKHEIDLLVHDKFKNLYRPIVRTTLTAVMMRFIYECRFAILCLDLNLPQLINGKEDSRGCIEERLKEARISREQRYDILERYNNIQKLRIQSNAVIHAKNLTSKSFKAIRKELEKHYYIVDLVYKNKVQTRFEKFIIFLARTFFTPIGLLRWIFFAPIVIVSELSKLKSVKRSRVLRFIFRFLAIYLNIQYLLGLVSFIASAVFLLIDSGNFF